MYEYVRGTLVAREDGEAVVECGGGVAYRLAISASTLRRLPPSGDVRLFTHLIVRDDSHDLVGFSDRPERHLFRQLLQVSGIGPAAALGLLSAYEPEALASHIAAGDLACLTRVKGIGKRTGERILVELRDRLGKEPVTRNGVASLRGGTRADAVRALCTLGLPRQEAELRVGAIEDDTLAPEEMVKEALRR